MVGQTARTELAEKTSRPAARLARNNASRERPNLSGPHDLDCIVDAMILESGNAPWQRSETPSPSAPRGDRDLSVSSSARANVGDRPRDWLAHLRAPRSPRDAPKVRDRSAADRS